MRIKLLLLFCLFTASASASGEGWIVRTDDPGQSYIGAPVANGMIGILPWKEPFSVRHVILNHVFDIDARSGVNRVLRGINPFGLTMYVDGQKVDEQNISDWSQQVDMRRAEHTTRFTTCGKVETTYTIAALRNMPHAGVVMVTVKALQDNEVRFDNRMENPGDYASVKPGYKALRAGQLPIEILRMDGTSSLGRQQVAAASAFLYDREQFSHHFADDTASLSVKLTAGEEVSFILAGSVCSTRDFDDPFSESEREVIFILHEGIDRIMKAHHRLWDELWQGDIEIEGDAQAQQVVRFALFNLYSYARSGSALSISPMGLSAQGYNGHIFWDTELWMYPPMLMLNQGIARSMVDYRTSRLGQAIRKADQYGYRGALYPWESDDAGQESCPVHAATGPFEHHISSDVAIACWDYYRMTGDREWLRSEGWPVLKAVADFWTSRAEQNADGSWSIINVVGADEYAEGVDDNAFTNGSAIRALEYAVAAAPLCGEKAPAQWREIARGLRIPHADGITLEYEGYDGRMIKQADVNLLGYPLGIISDPAQQRRDLAYYAERVDKEHGPAMTFSIFCVQYTRLGDAAKAEEMFRRCYQPNLRMPFGVLAETPTSQNPYFATCAGGLLQAVINGFGGLELTDKGIRQYKSVLPASWTKLTIKGVGTDRKTYVVTR